MPVNRPWKSQLVCEICGQSLDWEASSKELTFFVYAPISWNGDIIKNIFTLKTTLRYSGFAKLKEKNHCMGRKIFCLLYAGFFFIS